MKINKNARILHDILARKKLSKYPNFYDICPKNTGILHKNCPKKFPFFVGARPPVSYAYSPVSTDLVDLSGEFYK